MIVHMTVVKEQKVHPIASMLANSQYIENERKMVNLTIIKKIYSNLSPPPFRLYITHLLLEPLYEIMKLFQKASLLKSFILET